MIIGYGTSRDTLLLYSSGNKGVAQMSASVPDEVVFGFIMFEGSGVLVTHVSHKISQHDVTVNTSKPSELTLTMLRERTRHLAIKSVPMKAIFAKVAGGLGRSDSYQPSKLKPTVWHRRSQASSRSSTPPESALLRSVPRVVTSDSVSSTTGVGGMASSPATYPPNPDTASADDQTSKASDPESAPLHYDEPEPRGKLLDAPPTPKSFGRTPRLNGSSDTASEAGSDAAESSAASVPVVTIPAPAPEEPPVADSPIITHFDHRISRIEPAPAAVETDLPFSELPPTVSPPAVAHSAGGGSSPHESRPATSGSVASFASAAAVDHATPAFRYSSIRSRDGKSAASSLRSKSRGSVVSSSAQPEVDAMLEQVNQHRQDVAALAESTGILGDKYFEGLRGYTSIQEPKNAFWKRRYFVIADKTVFMYINECSRTPSDFLHIESVVSPPRDAGDEVLMPHSIAVDFGTGEYYMYFDSAPMREAFENEVRKVISVA
ncbi:hypothetical protein IWW37_003095 [Coemansia sp. RSA 2050]|nr:hypothetical protein IWW37_003095 [Coemansia sp. RSA 2050]